MAISLVPDSPTGGKNTTVSAFGEKDSPSVPHPTYTKLKHRWVKCRAFMGESEEIRAGREAYLFPIGSEGRESYEARLTLVAVTNFFKRAVLASVGLLLAKEPVLGDDMPAKLVAFAEDIDMKGMHVSVYAKEITQDHVVDGMAATLVDYPKDVQSLDASGKLSAADDAQPNLRPYFVKFLRSDVLKVIWGKIKGVNVPILVVLQVATERLDGSFGVKSVTEYRVYRHTETAASMQPLRRLLRIARLALNPGSPSPLPNTAFNGVTWEVWQSSETAGQIDQTTKPTPMRGVSRIPFSLFGDFAALPPLENLADLNIEHHNVKTNIRNLETLAMVPTRVRIGAQKDPETGTYPPLVYGAREVIEAPYIEGVPRPIYWDSPAVDVLEPSNHSLEDIKADIGTAALNFLAPDKRVAETAESKRIDSAAQNASLRTVGRRLQDHMEECFGFAAEMIGERGGSVTINMEFEDSPLTADEMRVYLEAVMNGKISEDTFIDAWKKGRRLDESLDTAAERKKILTENALPPDPAAGAAAAGGAP